MTADQRLDQLEPLLAQSLSTLDRHTSQLKVVIAGVMQQSDNIQFLLTDAAEAKEERATINQKLDRILDLLGNAGK
jgi:hypothetical protein